MADSAELEVETDLLIIGGSGVVGRQVGKLEAGKKRRMANNRWIITKWVASRIYGISFLPRK